MTNPPSSSDDGPEADPPIANPPYIGTERAAERAKSRRDGSGDGPGSGDMGLRVSHLEQRVERIEGKIDQMIHTLGGIASKTEMRTYLLTALGVSLALVAVLVTAMGWLETRAARVSSGGSGGMTPQPIVIQLPYPPQQSMTPQQDRRGIAPQGR